MPHANLWETQGVVVEYWGTVTGAEFAQTAQEIGAGPKFDELRFLIVDFTKVTDHNVDANAIEEVAAIRIGARATNPNVRVVLLVTAVERAAAIAHAMNAGPDAGSRRAMVFATMELARAWLAQQPRLDSLARYPRFDPDSSNH